MIKATEFANRLVEEYEKREKGKKVSYNRKDGVTLGDADLKGKIRSLSGYLWLTLVILATQEAEIRRITVQSQSQAKYLKKYSTENGW
jgi:hypothetical protein